MHIWKQQTRLYKEGEKLDAKCNIATTYIIIGRVDKELTNRAKIFQTQEKIDEEQVEFTIDFNNGTKYSWGKILPVDLLTV